MATPPTLDGFTSGAGTGSFGTVTLSTTQPNDVIVFSIFNEGPTARTVSSVTGAGLTFQKLGGFSGIDPARGTGHTVGQEIWWATTTSVLSSAVFTITMSGAFDDGVYIAFGVHGADPTAPWDSNSGLPVSGTGGTLTYSTSQSNDFIFVAYSSSTSSNPGTAALTGWTQLATNGTGAGSLFANSTVWFRTVTAAQASASVTSPSQNGPPAQTVGILAAITADSTALSSAPATGTVSLTGVAPNPALTGTPAAGALALAGQAPTPVAGQGVAPATGQISLAGVAPSLAMDMFSIPAAGMLNLLGLSPTPVFGILVAPPVGMLNLSGRAPSADIASGPGFGGITFTGFATNKATMGPLISMIY